MGFGKGFWPSLWFVQAFVEVFLSPHSAVAWVFLAVATVYWLLKIMQSFLPKRIGPLMWGLTAALWIVSSLSFL